MQTTTTPGSKKVTRRYTDLGGSYTYHTGRSQFIMSNALPQLRSEFLSAQSLERPDGLGRVVHEPGIRGIAPVGAREGEGLSAVAPMRTADPAPSRQPGLRRLEHVMGVPIYVDVRDETRRSADRAGVRVASLGRRDVQHLP